MNFRLLSLSLSVKIPRESSTGEDFHIAYIYVHEVLWEILQCIYDQYINRKTSLLKGVNNFHIINATDITG